MTPIVQQTSAMLNRNLLSSREVIVQKASITSNEYGSTNCKIGNVNCNSFIGSNPIEEGHICINENGKRMGHLVYKDGVEVKFNLQQEKTINRDQTYIHDSYPAITMSDELGYNLINVSSVKDFFLNTHNSDTSVSLFHTQAGVVDVSEGDKENYVDHYVYPKYRTNEKATLIKLGSNDQLLNQGRNHTSIIKTPGIYEVYETKPVTHKKISSIFIDNLFNR